MNRRDTALTAEFLAAIMGIVGWAGPTGPRYHAAPEKPAKKCFLSSCQTMTRHNGGYCCADHCREHRAILRTSNNNLKVGSEPYLPKSGSATAGGVE